MSPLKESPSVNLKELRLAWLASLYNLVLLKQNKSLQAKIRN